MWTLKMEELDEDARMIVQAVHLRMLKRLKDQLKTTGKEAAEKEAAEKLTDGEKEAVAAE